MFTAILASDPDGWGITLGMHQCRPHIHLPYPTLPYPVFIKSSATDPALNDSHNLPCFIISSLNLRQFDLNKPYLSKLGSLLEKFGDCGHSMAILREGMQTLFGPGYYLTTIPHTYTEV